MSQSSRCGDQSRRGPTAAVVKVGSRGRRSRQDGKLAITVLSVAAELTPRLGIHVPLFLPFVEQTPFGPTHHPPATPGHHHRYPLPPRVCAPKHIDRNQPHQAVARPREIRIGEMDGMGLGHVPRSQPERKHVPPFPRVAMGRRTGRRRVVQTVGCGYTHLVRIWTTSPPTGGRREQSPRLVLPASAGARPDQVLLGTRLGHRQIGGREPVVGRRVTGHIQRRTRSRRTHFATSPPPPARRGPFLLLAAPDITVEPCMYTSPLTIPLRTPLLHLSPSSFHYVSYISSIHLDWHRLLPMYNTVWS